MVEELMFRVDRDGAEGADVINAFLRHELITKIVNGGHDKRDAALADKVIKQLRLALGALSKQAQHDHQRAAYYTILRAVTPSTRTCPHLSGDLVALAKREPPAPSKN